MEEGLKQFLENETKYSSIINIFNLSFLDFNSTIFEKSCSDFQELNHIFIISPDPKLNKEFETLLSKVNENINCTPITYNPRHTFGYTYTTSSFRNVCFFLIDFDKFIRFPEYWRSDIEGGGDCVFYCHGAFSTALTFGWVWVIVMNFENNNDEILDEKLKIPKSQHGEVVFSMKNEFNSKQKELLEKLFEAMELKKKNGKYGEIYVNPIEK
jgi:hypothetical protein